MQRPQKKRHCYQQRLYFIWAMYFLICFLPSATTARIIHLRQLSNLPLSVLSGILPNFTFVETRGARKCVPPQGIRRFRVNYAKYFFLISSHSRPIKAAKLVSAVSATTTSGAWSPVSGVVLPVLLPVSPSPVSPSSALLPSP